MLFWCSAVGQALLEDVLHGSMRHVALSAHRRERLQALDAVYQHGPLVTRAWHHRVTSNKTKVFKSRYHNFGIGLKSSAVVSRVQSWPQEFGLGLKGQVSVSVTVSSPELRSWLRSGGRNFVLVRSRGQDAGFGLYLKGSVSNSVWRFGVVEDRRYQHGPLAARARDQGVRLHQEDSRD